MNFSMKIFLTRVEEFKLTQKQLKRDAKPKKNQREDTDEEEE